MDTSITNPLAPTAASIAAAKTASTTPYNYQRYNADGTPLATQNLAKDWIDSTLASITGSEPAWKIQEDIDKTNATNAANKLILASLKNTGGNTDQNVIDNNILDNNTSSLSGSSQGDKMYADVYGQKMQTLLDSINNLSNQANITKRNNQGTYDTNQNELDTTKANSDNSYKTSTTQNGQSYQTNKNTIADQASTGLRGLLRVLGAYGAGGSSAAEYLAPEAVANTASASRAGANQTYAVNQSGLDTNYNSFLNEDTNARKKLTDWLVNENQAADKTSLTNRQSLLTQLADAAGNKAAYSRGSYADASQPYIEQSKSLSPQIDALSGVASRTYDGKTPTYTAKSLASYIPTAAGTQVGTTAAQDVSTPYLSLLLSQQKKESNL